MSNNPFIRSDKSPGSQPSIEVYTQQTVPINPFLVNQQEGIPTLDRHSATLPEYPPPHYEYPLDTSQTPFDGLKDEKAPPDERREPYTPRFPQPTGYDSNSPNMTAPTQAQRSYYGDRPRDWQGTAASSSRMNAPNANWEHQPSFQQHHAGHSSYRDAEVPEPDMTFIHHPAPPIGARRSLPLPAVFPQLTSSFRGPGFSPFSRGYAPALAGSGVPLGDWLAFVDGLNLAFTANPPLQILGLAGGMIGMV